MSDESPYLGDTPEEIEAALAAGDYAPDSPVGVANRVRHERQALERVVRSGRRAAWIAAVAAVVSAGVGIVALILDAF